MLTSSTGTNYVLHKHEDVNQYDPYSIPSKIMPCYSFPESLVNQNEIPVDLSRERFQPAQIMSITSTKILTNMAHLQFYL